jgi:hypothetical protein
MENMLNQGLKNYRQNNFFSYTDKEFIFKEWQHNELVQTLRALSLPFIESLLCVSDYLVAENNLEPSAAINSQLLQHWRQLDEKQAWHFPEAGNLITLQNSYDTLVDLMKNLPNNLEKLAYLNEWRKQLQQHFFS